MQSIALRASLVAIHHIVETVTGLTRPRDDKIEGESKLLKAVDNICTFPGSPIRATSVGPRVGGLVCKKAEDDGSWSSRH